MLDICVCVCVYTSHSAPPRHWAQAVVNYNIQRAPHGLHGKTGTGFQWILTNSLWDRNLWEADSLGNIPRKNGQQNGDAWPGREKAMHRCSSKQKPSEDNRLNSGSSGDGTGHTLELSPSRTEGPGGFISPVPIGTQAVPRDISA